MADPRTFVLIGNFTDNITPSLQKINESLAKVKANLESVSKATKPLKQDFKELADLSNKFGSSLRTQATDIKEMTRAMRAMRNEMGRVNRAYKAGGRNIVQDSRRFTTPPPPPPPPPRTPRTPRYNYNEPPMPMGGPRARGGGGGGGYSGGGGRGGYSAAVGGAVAGSVIGNQAADFLTGAIVKGFQMGVSIMEKPFQYFANALGERIRDEMSDIKAAGGYFSIAKRQADPFVKTFDQALDFTQKNNMVMAKLAAALPGSTQDYIEVSKRIGDSIARTVMTDKGAAIAYANKLREEFPTMYGAQLQGTGRDATQGAITTLLGELTKKTVLAGQGGRSGAGGAIGPYGLPGLTERMLSQDQVSMGQFQRYSAIFADPMIMDALQREIPKINATAKNSIDRFKALQKFYDDVLPPEMIEKYRRSIAGLQEAFNTAILGPETGLFGIGRKMQGLGRKINDFGQYVDDMGNVVTDINNAAPANLSVFDMLRDVFANTAQVLMPIIENITLIYDPLRMIGLELKDARHYTAEFLKSFNQYRDGLVEYSKTLSKAAGGKLLETKDLRASFAAISNMFLQIGAIGKTDYDKISKQILDPNANVGNILKGLMDTFFNSEAAFKIGEFIGNLVGTVLSEVAKAMGVVTGMATGGPLANGLMEGFKKAGGSEAFASIIRNTFALLGKLLLDIVKAAPMETLFVAGLLMLPAVISGLISAAITTVLSKGLPSLMQNLLKVKPVTVKDLGKTTPITDPRRMLPAAKGVAGVSPVTGVAGAAKGVGGLGKGLGVLGKTLKSLGKAIPGLNIAFAGLDFTLGKMAGEDTATAAAGALGGLSGGLIGAAIGTAILPGLGTAIGAVLGTGVGDWVATSLTPYVKKIFSDPAGAIDQAKAGLQSSENKLREWFLSLPAKFGGWQKQFENGVEDEWMGLGFKFDQWQRSFGVWVQKFSTNTTADTSAKLSQFSSRMTSLFKEGINWQSLADTLVEGARGFFSNASSRLQALGDSFNWIREQYKKGYTGAPLSDKETLGRMRYDGNTTRPSRPLSAAISSEMRHKPSGSDLVIANSSETVIPAAGGHGMEAFIGTMRAGFNSIVQTYTQVQQKQEATLKQINSTLVSNQQQTNTRLSTLETKFASPSIPGGLGGGAAGGVDAFTPMAQQMGLTMTSGYRPGDPGWHGANRARDFSNGTGPTPQMMQFAQMLASKYGSNLKELIYTPLGFSIKNGQRVAPYAQGAHYNHVHVAYANGIGQGMAFNSLKGAQDWENSMVKGSVKVGSITANSGEGFGGSPVNVTNNISISQQPGQSADELAAIVAIKIGEAVADARAASIFV